MKGSMEEILRFVEQNDAFSIISHVAPDGDTIGSGTALSRILRRLGKRTETYAATKYPTRISSYRVLKRYCCRRMPGASMR